MTSTLPHHHVPRSPIAWGNQPADPAGWTWDALPALPSFILANGSGLARQQTLTRVCHDARALYVRFDCDDRDIWGTCTRRDEPIYEEEVVELFISPGAATPVRYYEFEVNPNGALLDAMIYNPTSERAELVVDLSWDCPALRWETGRDDLVGRWWTILIIPWLALAPTDDLPTTWRANFYRIERPRDVEAEFSCWSPTMTHPADFHKPAYFGTLLL